MVLPSSPFYSPSVRESLDPSWAPWSPGLPGSSRSLSWPLTLRSLGYEVPKQLVRCSILNLEPQIIKKHVNSDGSGSRAHYSTGMWTCLAAMILLFLGMFIVLFTCFSARKAKKSASYKTTGDAYATKDGYHHGNGYDSAPAPTNATHPRKKRFGIF